MGDSSSRPRPLRPLCAPLICSLLLLPTAWPQSVPQPAKNTLKSDVNEVLLDLVVRDKHGRPVKDLQPGEIEITDDGSPVKVTALHLANAGAEPDSTAPSSSASSSLHRVRLFSLVFDRLHTESTREARKVADELLKQAGSGQIAFSVWKLDPQLELVQTFTTNQSQIHAAVESVLKPKNGSAVASPSSTSASTSTDVTGLDPVLKPIALKMLSAGELSAQIAREENVPPFVAGLLALLRQNSLFPGRKTLLYFSDGAEIASVTSAERQSIVGAANRSSVSIYAVDTSGSNYTNEHTEGLGTLHGNMGGTNTGKPAVAQNSLAAPSVADTLNGVTNQASVTASTNATHLRRQAGGSGRLPLEELANQTGGFLLTEDTNKNFAGRILDESESYYEASYVPAQLEYDGHFRTINVKVARPQTRVQSRAGYYSFPPNAAGDIRPFELPLLKALDQPQRTQTIPLNIRILQFGSQGDQARAELLVAAPMADMGHQEDNHLWKMHISVVALLKSTEGQVLQKLSEDLPLETAWENSGQVRTGAFTFQRSFSSSPGQYVLDIALYDQINKRLSTARFPVTLSPALEGLNVSDIVLVRKVESKLGPQDPLLEYQGGKIVPDLEPAAGARDLPFFFAIYPPAGSSSKPRVQIELTQAHSVLARSALPVPDAKPGERIPIVGAFSSRKLPDGDYEMIAKVTQDDVTRERRLPFTVSGTGVAPARTVTQSPHPEEAPVTLSLLVEPKLLADRAKPDASEVRRVIDSARRRAIDYKSDLPNFTCTLVTRRELDKNGSQNWQRQDVLTELLRYVNGAEDHKILHVDNRSGTAGPSNSAFRSEGEFGLFLDAVFSQKADAHFEWQGYTEVNGQPADTYKYEVPLSRSLYSLTDRDKRISVAYRGFIYIDPNTMTVRRVSIEAENVPKDFPIRESAISVDYAYTSIGDQQYLLPRSAMLYARQGKRRISKNEKQFREYRRYTGAATLKFD